MTVLNTADKVWLGSTLADVVYAGTNQIWPKPLDPDTTAYMTPSGLSSAYAPALDALVKGLKGYGLWTKLVAAYPMVGGSAALHRWNLKDPRDLDAAYRLTFTGGTHTTALGYRANPQGVVTNAGHADSHLVPLGTLDPTSLHLSYYGLQEVPGISRCEIGCYNWAGSGSRFHLLVRYSPGGTFYWGMNEDGLSGVDLPGVSLGTSLGLFVGSRLTASDQRAYRNGLKVSSNTLATIALSYMPVWVGGLNGYPDQSDVPCGWASIGSGMTDQNVADLYTVVQNFQTALGRAV
jgi:hypothetical protein